MSRSATALLIAAALASGCSAGRKSQFDYKPTDAVKAAEGETFESKLAEGDAAWGKRDDKASLEVAIKAWERASELKPDDAAVLAKLARGYYLLADGHLRKLGNAAPEYLSTFEKGVAYGERALATASPKFKEHVVAGGKIEEGVKLVDASCGVCLEAMYWYASSLGKWARAKGFTTTLGNKDRILGVMTKALEMDPEGKFFYGAVQRYFGSFYGVAPGFAGGDMNKSKDFFEKSLAIAPNYAGTKVLYADVWAVKKQDRALFDKLLDEVLAMPDDALPDAVPEIRIEKEKAKELKAKAAELF
jgi:tetratricopeptide (TPR) repeat protein